MPGTYAVDGLGLVGDRFQFPGGIFQSEIRFSTPDGLYVGSSQLGAVPAEQAWIYDARWRTLVPLGLDDPAVPNAIEQVRSSPTGLGADGVVVGTSQFTDRFASWVYDAATGMTRPIGPDLSVSQFARELLPSGHVLGSGETSRAWLYNARTNESHYLGMSDPEHLGRRDDLRMAYTTSNVYGDAIGISDRFRLDDRFPQGVSAWFFDADTGQNSLVGLRDGVFINPTSGDIRTTPLAINARRQAIGISQGYDFQTLFAAWLYDHSTGTTIPIGIVSNPGGPGGINSAQIRPLALNDAGVVLGHSQFVTTDEQRTLRDAIWMYDSVANTTVDFDFGAPLDPGVSVSTVAWNNHSQAILDVNAGGTSGRYAAFVQLQDRLALRLDQLYADQNPDSSLRDMSVTNFNDSPIVSGTATRVVNGQLRGTMAWVFDSSTRGMTRVGLHDATHTDSVGNQESTVGYQTDNGIVAGTSLRYSRRNVNGSSAWAYDPQSGQTTSIGLLDDIYFGRNGRHESHVDGLVDGALIYGRSQRFDPNTGSAREMVSWVYVPDRQETVPLVFSTRSDGYSETQFAFTTLAGARGVAGSYRRFGSQDEDLGLFPFYWAQDVGFVDVSTLSAVDIPSDEWLSLERALAGDAYGNLVGQGQVNRLNGPFSYPYALVPRGESGDFNHDGVLDLQDVEQLGRAIRTGFAGAHMELDGNDIVNQQDLRVWVNDLKRTYFGDANLDLVFDSGDLIQVFQAGYFERPDAGTASWGSGDWNSDGAFDSGDLVLAFAFGGYDAAPRSPVAVPEPGVDWLLLSCVLAACRRWRPFRLPRLAAGSMLLGLLLLTAAASSLHAAPHFEVIHGWEGGYTRARAISPNGQFVVGELAGAEVVEGFRWTRAGGLTLLALDGNESPFVSNAVADVGTVVGHQPEGIYFWTPVFGRILIDSLPSDTPQGFANDVSADGFTIVGMSRNADSEQVPVRWSTELGLVPLTGDRYRSGEATAISADGSVIVGAGDTRESAKYESWRWSEAEGFQPLQPPIGVLDLRRPEGVSSDGTYIVGGMLSGADRVAFRWSVDDGAISLGVIDSTSTYSVAYGVSDDGRRVVGQGTSQFGARAFLWEPSAGIRDLNDVVSQDYGLDLEGWILRDARDLSADGETIVGLAFHPDGMERAYYLELPRAPPNGDFDGDGVLTAADIDDLMEQVRSGALNSDFDLNQDQRVDRADVEFWVTDLKRTYFGDANLDGQFDPFDFVTVFQQGEYEDQIVGNSGWSDGDWNGDAEFNSSDLITAFQGGGYDRGPRSSVAVHVPEPGFFFGYPLAGLLLIAASWRGGATGLRPKSRSAIRWLVALLLGANGVSQVRAQDSAFINSTGGSWQTESHWTNGTPNGAGATAQFLTAPLGNNHVTIDASVAVSGIELGTSRRVTLSGTDLLTFQEFNDVAPSLRLANNARLTFAVPTVIDSNLPLIIDQHSSAQSTFAQPISGPGGISIPAGNVTFLAANQFEGPVDLGTNTTLTIQHGASLGDTMQATTVGTGAVLQIRPGADSLLLVAEPMNVEGGTIDFASNSSAEMRLTGPLRSSGGNTMRLRLSSADTPFPQTIASLDGGLTTDGDVLLELTTSPTSFSGSAYFTVHERPLVIGGTLTLDSWLHTYQTGARAFLFYAPVMADALHVLPSNEVRNLDNLNDQLFGNVIAEFNAPAEFGRIRIDDFAIGGTASVTSIAPELELNKGIIQFGAGGGLRGVQRIVKQSSSQARIYDLGDVASPLEVDVHRGLLFWRDTAVRDNVLVNVGSDRAALLVEGDAYLNVRLHGGAGLPASPGALRGFDDSAVIHGQVEAGPHQVTLSNITLNGPMTGSGRVQVSDFVTLRGPQPFEGSIQIPHRAAMLVVEGPLLASPEINASSGTRVLGEASHFTNVSRVVLDDAEFSPTGSGALRNLIITGGDSLLRLNEASTVTLDSLTISPHARLRISSRGQEPLVHVLQPPMLSDQILGGGITVETGNIRRDFATLDPNGEIVPLPRTGRAPQIVDAQPSDHVLVTRQISPMTDDRTVASFQSLGQINTFHRMNMNGHRLTVTTGGFYLQGRSLSIENGEITTAGEPLFLIADVSDSLSLSATLVDHTQPLTVILDGDVDISSTNTYTGETFIYGDVIARNHDAIPRQRPIRIKGGSLNYSEDRELVVDRVEVVGGSLLTNNQPIEFTELMIDDSFIVGRLRGNGTLRKTGVGHVRLSGTNHMTDFAGPVRIEQGLLSASQVSGMLGRGPVTIESEGGLLIQGPTESGQSIPSTTVQNSIELQGGFLAAGRSGQQEELRRETLASFRFTGDITLSREARIVTTNVGFTGLPARPQATNVFEESPSDLQFRGQVRLLDGARVGVQGPGRLTWSNQVLVAGDTSVSFDAVDARITGTIVADNPQAVLNTQRRSAATLDWSRASIVVPANTGLMIQNDAESITFELGRSTQSLSGSGILRNSVLVVDDGIINPGDGNLPGMLTVGGSLLMAADGRYTWTIADATGSSDNGSVDQLLIDDALEFTVGDMETWRLTPRSVDMQGEPAPLLNFAPDGNYAWLIAEAGAIRGFDPLRVELDLSDWLLRNPATQVSAFHVQQRGATLWLVYGKFSDLPCDLNGDQTCDVQDIDAITNMIRLNEYSSSYDLNADGALNQTDRELWVVQMQSSFGDANLDGLFDSTDFVQVFQAGLYEDDIALNATWGTGDWNGDGDFSSSDLVLAFQVGGYQSNTGPSVAVPEPTSRGIYLIGVLTFMMWYRGQIGSRCEVSRMATSSLAAIRSASCRRWREAYLAAIVVVAALSVDAEARETSWRVPNSSGNWSQSSSWTLGTPGNDDIGIVSRNGVANFTDGHAALDQLRVGHSTARDVPANGTVRQAGGTITANNITVGNDGVFEISDGTLSTTSALSIGSNGQGTFQQLGGQVTAASARVGIATTFGDELRTGDGLYQMRDGNLSVLELVLGAQAASGTFEHLGGHITIENGLNVYSSDTMPNPSVFQSSAGQLTTRQIRVTGGRLEQLGGTWDALGIGIAADENTHPAEFTLAGGALHVHGVSIGNQSNRGGTMMIRGGSMDMTQIASAGDSGRFALFNGSVVQSGGSVIADRILLSTDLGSRFVRYDLTGGRIESGDLSVGGLGDRFRSNGVLSVQDSTVEMSVARLDVGGRQGQRSSSPGTLEFTQPPAMFEVTESFELGAAATYRAVAGTQLLFRGESLRIVGQSPASVDGLQFTELVFDPTVSEGEVWPQIDLEVAGRIDGVGSLLDNYGWGRLTVPVDVSVEVNLVDHNDNQPSINAPEALFVDELVIGPGAKLKLSGTSKLFYRSLMIDPTAELLADANQLVPWNSSPGDFSGDGVLDILDLDLLMAALGGSDLSFDLNRDDAVTVSDLRTWVREIRGTWFGDANLDGQFDTDDLVQVFAGGQFEDDVPGNSQWLTGDFNGDRDFTTGDLVSAFQDGGYRRGPRATLAIPEPDLSVMIGVALVGVSLNCRRQQRRRQQDSQASTA